MSRYATFTSKQRWLALGVLSVLLHLLLLGWADGQLRPMATATPSSIIITATLLSPPIPADVVITPTPAPVMPPRRKPQRVSAPTVRAPAIKPPAPSAPDTFSTSIAGISQDVPVAQALAPPLAQAVTLPDAVETAAAVAADVNFPAAPPPASFKVTPPPAVVLTYTVHALRGSQDWYGSGEIKWQSDGRDYLVTGTASVSALMFKITALNFWSKGQIDDFGVAPLIYSETRFRKSETNTHFRREPDMISFSASTTTYARTAGAQDRASIMWQLAGIGNGDPGKFIPGAEIDLFVAGVRDAETWRIRIIKEEQVDLGIGKISAWHVSRAPRSGSYEQKIDIWLAPQRHWYPVKILYTEANGDYLDLSLSSLENATP